MVFTCCYRSKKGHKPAEDGKGFTESFHANKLSAHVGTVDVEVKPELKSQLLISSEDNIKPEVKSRLLTSSEDNISACENIDSKSHADGTEECISHLHKSQCTTSGSDVATSLLKNRLKETHGHYTSKESLFIVDSQEIPHKYIIEERHLKAALSSQNEPEVAGTNDEFQTESRCFPCKPLNFICSFYQWSLCSNTLFLIFLMCQAVGCANYVNLFVYLPPFAIEIGISKERAGQLLSIVGVADLIGRISGGFIADFSFINRSYLVGGTMAATGVVALFTTFYPSYVTFVMFSIVLGAIGGTFVSLLAVVLIDFLGLEHFSSAIGLAIMFQGFVNTAWPSFLGKYSDFCQYRLEVVHLA